MVRAHRWVLVDVAQHRRGRGVAPRDGEVEPVEVGASRRGRAEVTTVAQRELVRSSSGNGWTLELEKEMLGLLRVLRAKDGAST